MAGEEIQYARAILLGRVGLKVAFPGVWRYMSARYGFNYVELGHEPELHDFKEIYFKALNPNDEMIAEMRAAKESGLRMALLTNNVREWEPLWRSKLPIDEIFDDVVDSAFVGMRKPEPDIYLLTVERLGDGSG